MGRSRPWRGLSFEREGKADLGCWGSCSSSVESAPLSTDFFVPERCDLADSRDRCRSRKEALAQDRRTEACWLDSRHVSDCVPISSNSEGGCCKGPSSRLGEVAGDFDIYFEVDGFFRDSASGLTELSVHNRVPPSSYCSWLFAISN